MLTMDQVHHIRQLYFEQGYRVSEIAREMHLDRRTVSKYLDQEDFNPPPPKPLSPPNLCPKLEPYKPIIDEWLQKDKFARRKQRHTAQRVFDRLTKEVPEFDCSYRLVAQYVSVRKKELNLTHQDGAIPLLHHPGEAQADFGTADFIENGRLRKDGKYLVLSFPYSNAGYFQLHYGENMECLLESLVAIFEHIGGVPREIWFDNTTTIVSKIIRGGGRVTTERFTRFAEHYGFRPVFCNPNSGNEKGNTENKVGYSRRNFMVPVPEFNSLEEFNQRLLMEADEDHHRSHYMKEKFISELFEEDKGMLLPLPKLEFDLAGHLVAKTNKYGKITLDGKYTYSASPDLALETVHVRLTSDTVTILDCNLREVISHRRLYGPGKQESMEWLPYLKYVSKRPRSLRNSGIYDMLPYNVQQYLDACLNTERGQVLRILSDLTERTGFDSAVQTIDQAILYKAKDPDSLQNLYRRLYADVPELPPIPKSENIPNVIPIRPDMSVYDSVLQGGFPHG